MKQHFFACPRWMLAFVLLFVTSMVQAFEVPELTGPVMDQVGWLTSSDRHLLEEILRDFWKTGKAQVQVAIVQSLQGEGIEQVSIQITDKWKLGEVKKDNGVLFLLAAQDRKMRIEVGRGLEGDLTDLASKRITSDVVKPLMRAGRPSEAILMGTIEILRKIDPEYIQKLAQRKDLQAYHLEEVSEDSTDLTSNWKQLIIFVFLIGFVILSMILRMLGLSGGDRRGPWVGGGPFGGGSSSGGGWSGGGGGFSGGGASDSW
jgi:uncharacterized protein